MNHECCAFGERGLAFGVLHGVRAFARGQRTGSEQQRDDSPSGRAGRFA
jgi:hypothetical protein